MSQLKTPVDEILDDLVDYPDVMLSWDESDPYGSAMSLWFDCAEFLFFELGEEVPAHWEFSPSSIQTEISPENFFRELSDFYGPYEIATIGDACQAVSEFCKENGLAY